MGMKFEQNSKSNVAIVLSSYPLEHSLDDFLKFFVEQKLIACASVIPECTSLFSWNSGVQNEKEQLILMKTLKNKLKVLEALWVEKHPYEVPEFLIISTNKVNESYGRWIEEIL